jgi:hypothetical protein
MDSNKNLINEHIGQQFESLKALMKAYVNKEDKRMEQEKKMQ